METRIERYARYRENIRKLPDDAFDDEGKFANTLNQKELRSLSNMGYSAGAISYPGKADAKVMLDLTPDEERKSPYSYYLSKKRRAWIIKIIIALILAGALAAVYFLWVVR